MPKLLCLIPSHSSLFRFSNPSLKSNNKFHFSLFLSTFSFISLYLDKSTPISNSKFFISSIVSVKFLSKLSHELYTSLTSFAIELISVSLSGMKLSGGIDAVNLE